MNDAHAPAILRTLIIYAVIVPLAIFIGYLLTDPTQLMGRDPSSMAFVGILVLVMAFPLLMRWHHPLLVFSWNASMYIMFLPGAPDLWLGMTAISLGITLLQRTLGGVKRLLSVPQVSWSLICMTGVVLLTAKLTGFGMHAFGDEISGGRRYISLLGSLLAYFALSTRRIPPERANLYVGLFFLPALTESIGDLWGVTPAPLRFIFGFFHPRDVMLFVNPLEENTRLYGAMMGAISVIFYMQAKYGIRGIFLSGKTWRWMVVVLAFGCGMLGGFRSGILFICLTFAIQFYIEGLHRTKLLPIFAVAGVLVATALVPLAPHLPHTVQRALSFLPLEIDVAVRRNAEDSENWRLDMWKALLPQIPRHLLLGKGYAWSRVDMDLLTGRDAAIKTGFADTQAAALGGSYHSGPLSVILTFGIWAAIVMIWFWAASLWVLYHNYRYGDPALRTVNTLLLAVFVARIIFFLFIFGDIDGDILRFGGWIGLSVALNGGVCRPAPVPATASKYPAFDNVRSHLQPTFRRPNVRA